MDHPRVMPKNGRPYVALVCMYMSNCGMTLEEAEAEANEQWPRSYPPEEPAEPHVCDSDDCCPPF